MIRSFYDIITNHDIILFVNRVPPDVCSAKAIVQIRISTVDPLIQDANYSQAESITSHHLTLSIKFRVCLSCVDRGV